MTRALKEGAPKVPLMDGGRGFSQRPISEVRKLTLEEFAEQFEGAIKERQDLALRLERARQEIAAMTQERAELDAERKKLNEEIDRLRLQLSDQARKNQNAGVDKSAEYLVSAREKLIRDEFEKRYQELNLEVKNQRKKYTKEVEVLRERLSLCICQATSWD